MTATKEEWIAWACKMEAQRDVLLEALKEISEGRGPFSTDRYEHACNVIEAMKETALAALSRAQVQS